MIDNEFLGDPINGTALRIVGIMGDVTMTFADIPDVGVQSFLDYYFETPLSELALIAQETAAIHIDHGDDCFTKKGTSMFLEFAQDIKNAKSELAAGIPAEWETEK